MRGVLSLIGEKTGCEAELFLKNPKKYFEGFFSGVSRGGGLSSIERLRLILPAVVLLSSTDGNENAKRIFLFHHYYGLTVPFFQMAAVFFFITTTVRPSPVWANRPPSLPTTPRNVRFVKNGRKKKQQIFSDLLLATRLWDRRRVSSFQ